MFIDLIDVLRCPNAHEESWLVLATTRLENRDVIEGTLGCPICRAEFSIVGGVVRFADSPSPQPTPSSASEEDALRIAALLDLTQPRGFAILVGAAAAAAPRIRDLIDGQVMLVNPPPAVEMGGGLSGLTVPDDWSSLPLAAASARAIALDDSTNAQQLDAAMATLRVGGRILGPIGLPLPNGATELARDDRNWLAERAATPAQSGIVSIDRRR